jgi:hypothetical protein
MTTQQQHKPIGVRSGSAVVQRLQEQLDIDEQHMASSTNHPYQRQFYEGKVAALRTLLRWVLGDNDA